MRIEGSGKLKLTIAIPSYNKGKTISRTLDSIESQITDEVEVLISDNASTDDTEAIVREYQKKYGNIRYLKQKTNIGADGNFLKCYLEAKGQYIYLLSSDDILADGAISVIMSFINANPDVDVVFLNHYFFDGNDIGIEANANRMFLDIKSNYITTDKDKFISEVKYQLTYMCSFMLSKKAFESVANPEKYIGTFFIHACIAFEASKHKDCLFGVIYNPIVAQDLTPGSSNIITRFFEVFGEKEHYLLCCIAPEFGYNEKKMNFIFYSHAIRTWPKAIVEMRIKGVNGWKENYVKYGKKLVKKSAKLYLFMIPALYCPVKILKAIKKIYKIMALQG